jgi:hypothetical protein
MIRNEDPSPISKRRLPYLLRFLGLHLLLGAATGVAFVSLFLLANIAGLKDLIATSSEPFLPLFLFYTFNVLTFSSVAMGAAIMRLPWDER